LAASTSLVAAAASALLVSAASSIVWTTTLLAPGEVGRRPASADDEVCVVLLVTLLEGEEVGVDLVERDVVVARGQGGHQRVVVRPKASQDYEIVSSSRRGWTMVASVSARCFIWRK
jgi:hypothetical protein